MKCSRNAFSLLELSIVLVILGLLVGGVMSGRYLIAQAELKSALTDLTRYKAADFQFRDMYNGRPGDLKDATAYWPSDTCPTNTNRVPKRGTCDGNGNRVIEGGPEAFRAWQHLSNAELIDGRYSGVAGSGGVGHAVGNENAPSGRIKRSVYYLYGWSAFTGDSVHFDNYRATDILILGGQHTTSWPSSFLLEPKQMYQIDTKMDDGKPATGAITSLKIAQSPNCITNDTTASEYLLTYTSVACVVTYRLDY